MADFSPTWPGVAGGIGGFCAVALLARTARRDAEHEGDTAVLTYGRPVKILAGVFWLCWLGFFALAVVAPEKDTRLAAGFVLVALAVALAMHLEVFGVRVEFDGCGIRTRSPWRAARQIPWSDVKRAWYSLASQWTVIETERQGRVRLPDLLGGVDSLLTELERRGVPVVRRPAP